MFFFYFFSDDFGIICSILSYFPSALKNKTSNGKRSDAKTKRFKPEIVYVLEKKREKKREPGP